MLLLCYPLFLLYKLLNMFRATTCPPSGADDCVVLSPRVDVVPWLQEGCQNRLAGSVSIEEFVTTNSSMDTLRSRQLLKVGTWLPETCWATCKGEIKDNTKVTSSGFLIHTELQCTVNHALDLYLRCTQKCVWIHCYWPVFTETEMCCHILVKVSIQNFMKICSGILLLLHAYRWTSRHSEATGCT